VHSDVYGLWHNLALQGFPQQTSVYRVETMHTLSPPLFTSAPHNRLHFGEQKVPHAINKKLAKAFHNSTKAMITVTFDLYNAKKITITKLEV